MLKFTKIELELIQSNEKMLFLEKAKRGGIFQCTHRYSKENV